MLCVTATNQHQTWFMPSCGRNSTFVPHFFGAALAIMAHESGKHKIGNSCLPNFMKKSNVFHEVPM
jgi:hypothetical protein